MNFRRKNPSAFDSSPEYRTAERGVSPTVSAMIKTVHESRRWG
jgi:hypothetical protein